jgi:hypothetical protein
MLVEVVVVHMMLRLLELAVVAVLVMAHQPLRQTAQTLPLQTVALVEVVQITLRLLEQVATVHPVLSLSKYLTTYPQHSLVALHLACPHLVGSTSTL